MDETKVFCERLASQFHEVGVLLEEHLTDNDELLPHVFFGDLTRYTLANGKEKAAVVQCIENALSNGSHAINELITASFVENIETQDELAEVLLGVNGTKIQEAWNHQHSTL